jgi:hypothetical protein
MINRMQFVQDFARGAKTGDKEEGAFLFAKQKANTLFPRIFAGGSLRHSSAFLSPGLDGAVLPNILSLYFCI